MSEAEIYVVRIYRREAAVPNELIGVVDIIASGTRHAFKSADELWAILSRPEPSSTKRGLALVRGKAKK